MKTTQCCMTLSRDPQNTRIQSNQKRRSAVALQAVVTNKRKQNNLKKGEKKEDEKVSHTMRAFPKM